MAWRGMALRMPAARHSFLQHRLLAILVTHDTPSAVATPCGSARQHAVFTHRKLGELPRIFVERKRAQAGGHGQHAKDGLQGWRGRAESAEGYEYSRFHAMVWPHGQTMGAHGGKARHATPHVCSQQQRASYRCAYHGYKCERQDAGKDEEDDHPSCTSTHMQHTQLRQPC